MHIMRRDAGRHGWALWLPILVGLCIGTKSRAQNTDIWAPQNNPSFDHTIPSFSWNTSDSNWTVNGVTAQKFQNGDNVYFDDNAPGWNEPGMGPPYSPAAVFITQNVNPDSITVVSHNVGSDFTIVDYANNTQIGNSNPANPTTLTKLGPGGLLFLDGNGGANADTFTGAINVDQGTLSILLGSFSFFFEEVGENFEYLNNHNPSINLLSPSCPLVMGGGHIEVVGQGMNFNNGWQTFNNTVIASGSSSIDERTASNGENTSLNLGLVTRNVGGVVDFEIGPEINGNSAINAITASNSTVAGIIGGWATYGVNDWATMEGANIVPLSSNGGYSPDAWAAAKNTDVTTSSAPAASSTTNSLRFNAAGGFNTITLTGNNTLSSGGILVTPNVGANNVAITGGTLASGNGQDLIIIQNNPRGSLIIGSQIVGSTGLTLSGAGTASLTAENTYSGPTTINGGWTAYQVTGASPSQSLTSPQATSSTLTVRFLADGGLPSSIGSSSNAASNLVINGGTLQYIGSGDSTDRLFAIGPSGATLDSSGAGAVQFTNPGSVVISQNTTVSLTLAGSSTAVNLLNAVIPDPTPAANAPAYSLSLVKNGSGTWAVGGTNTYSGGTTINGGMLITQNNYGSATGSGQVRINAGTLVNDGSIVGDAAGEDLISAGGGTGVTIVNNGTINCTGAGTTIFAFGSGTSPISITNNGSIIAGPNTQNGPLTIGNGTFINNPGATVVGPSSQYVFEDQATFVNNGTINSPFLAVEGTISGTGTYSGASAEIAGSIIQPDNGTSPGVMTFQNSLQLDGGTELSPILGHPNLFGAAGGNDLINVPAGNAGDGTLILYDTIPVAINAGPDFAPGTYQLIHYAGTLSDQSMGFSNWTISIGSNPANDPIGHFVLDTANGNLDLVIDVLSLTWNNAAGTGLWNTSDVNWSNGTSNTRYFEGCNITFDDTNNGNYGVTLNNVAHPNSLTFNNSNGDYVVSGTGSIAGATSLTKNGSGKVILNTVNTYSGGTNVSAGTLIIGVTGALPNGAVNITGGTLRLASGTGLATISSLSISGGTFDLSNNHVIINYGAGPDPIASIAAYLATGYNGGAWNGAGGIVTSALLSTGGASYGLGYADAADPGNPAALNSGTIEIKYTLLGDANLDGTVNGVDFGILAANFNKSVNGWDQADFNYDNIDNGVDFGELAANFNKGASGAADWISVLEFAQANGLMADVPEPTAASFVIISLAAMSSRRRRSID